MKSQEIKDEIQKISTDLEELGKIKLETPCAIDEADRIRGLMQERIKRLTLNMNSAKVSEEIALLMEKFPEYRGQ